MSSTRREIMLGAASLTAASSGRVAGANERIRLGVIGTGPRGQWLMKAVKAVAGGGVEIVAVCDVYDVRRHEALALADAGAEQYLDYRQLLERKDIDAVIIATPDHWHGPQTVDALNAGKDVYVEKPMVHQPRDGQAIVRAARANRRIVQVGLQGRGLAQFVEAKQKYIDTGIIGKVGLARTWYTSNTGYIRTAPAGFEKKPEGLEWDRWLGPGPKVPWNPDIYFSPYKWLHYDGGMIMGIAVHVIDSAHHWLGLKNPVAAVAGGGLFYYKDGRDTPDVIAFVLEYPQEVAVTFTAECLTAPGVPTSAGVELRGTGGTLWAARYKQESRYEYTPNSKFSSHPPERVEKPPVNAENILRNWLECIRSRQRPWVNEEEGYYSAIACFMASQAYRTRSRVVWDRRWDLPA